MHTWKSHLRGVLHRLARTHAQTPIDEIQRLLGETFDAHSVRFLDTNQNPIDPQLPLRDLLARPFCVVVNVEMPVARNGRAPELGGAPRFQPEIVAPEQRVPWFIREFDRLEKTHEFMWAGYIVKEMLPRIGVATAEARQMLDELQEQGVVVVEKIHNPKNPQHPASAVRLVRDNAQVREILGDAAAD